MTFLDSVGVWFAVEDYRERDVVENPHVREMLFQGAIGYRSFKRRAIVATVESLLDEQK